MTEKQGAAEWLREKARRLREAEWFSCLRYMDEKFGIECEGAKCSECYASLFENIADRIDAERALPEGMEWPRFEDGELVRLSDEVEWDGDVMRVGAFWFHREGWSLNVSCPGLDGTFHGEYGERVKRPTPKVLDADGVEIRVGDTVYLRSNGRKGKVVGFYEDKGETWVGETWVSVSYELGSDRMTVNTEGKALTHERPDSWECIEEDAAKRVCEYAGAQKSIADADRYTCLECPYDEPGPHTDAGCNERMRLDLVRRAKALAKAGE